MICPRPRQPFLSAEEESRLSSFAPDIVKVLRPDAPMRADGCNLRFGNKGSLLIRSTGTWSDFEAGKSGDGALALIAHLRACSLAEALAWARDWLAQHPGQGSFSIAHEDDEARRRRGRHDRALGSHRDASLRTRDQSVARPASTICKGAASSLRICLLKSSRGCFGSTAAAEKKGLFSSRSQMNRARWSVSL